MVSILAPGNKTFWIQFYKRNTCEFWYMTGFRKNGSNDFFDPKLWKSSNSCYVMDLLSDPFKIKNSSMWSMDKTIKPKFFFWFAKFWARLVILIHFLEQKSTLEFLTESDIIFDHSSFPKFRHLYFLGWLGTVLSRWVKWGQARSKVHFYREQP